MFFRLISTGTIKKTTTIDGIKLMQGDKYSYYPIDEKNDLIYLDKNLMSSRTVIAPMDVIRVDHKAIFPAPDPYKKYCWTCHKTYYVKSLHPAEDTLKCPECRNGVSK